MKKLPLISLLLISFFSFTQSMPEDLENIVSSNPELAAYIKNQQELTSDQETITGQDKSIDSRVDIQDDNQLGETKQPVNNIFGFDFINSIPKSITSTSDLPVPGDYVISLGDKLKIILTGAKDAMYTLQVGMDGSILFPELGALNVFGDSIKEIRKKIEQLVGLSYVGVDVSVSLESLAAKKINIIGAVKNPGTYIVSPFSTITSALTYSGGFEDFASLRNIILLRDGEKLNFDFYEFLIRGSRESDINIQQSDTILVQATNNLVEIKGSVNRPKIYEYLPSDTYSDLLNFALGVNKNGDDKNITATINKNGAIITERINNIDMIRDNSLEEIFVGNKVSIASKDVFVSGSAVTSGFYSASNENLDKFLENLKFSDDIYPFYSVYESTDQSGLFNLKTSFSLSDPSTYSELTTTKNTTIYFLDRKEAMNYDYLKQIEILKDKERNATNFEEKQNIQETIKVVSDNFSVGAQEKLDFQIDYEIDPEDFISVFFPTKTFKIPVKGKISPKQLHLFLGSSSQIDLNKVSIITDKDNFNDAYEMVTDAENLVAISFPPLKNDNLIDVVIRGEVINPGTYSVASSTTLTDLYTLAGGLNENAFEQGIIFSREEVKQKQIKAIREAKSILTDRLIQKSNSLSEGATIDIESILAMADLIEPTGRISGEFSQSSSTAKQFILKDGDIINVPSISYEIVVQGEVLNSSSFIFNENMNHYDYIAAAGGFSDYADKRAVFVIKANGASIIAGSSIFGGQIKIEPGDTIVVPRNLDQLEALPLISMATKIIADIAFSAASLNAIQD